MQRKEFRAGAVKEAFWFQEFRRFVRLLADGKSYAEIRELNEAENIFGAATETRRQQIFRTLAARLQCFDSSFAKLFVTCTVTAQKQLALAAVMAADTLFFDFVNEVLHEKFLLGKDELTEADMRGFFHRKQMQDERAVKWTEATLQRLGRTYRSILTEAGMLEKKNGGTRKIYPLLLDAEAEQWLNAHGMSEIVQALQD